MQMKTQIQVKKKTEFEDYEMKGIRHTKEEQFSASYNQKILTRKKVAKENIFSVILTWRQLFKAWITLSSG